MSGNRRCKFRLTLGTRATKSVINTNKAAVQVPALVSNDAHQITQQGRVVSAKKMKFPTNNDNINVCALAVAPKICHQRWINVSVPTAVCDCQNVKNDEIRTSCGRCGC
jgi:hypothetical protein